MAAIAAAVMAGAASSYMANAQQQVAGAPQPEQKAKPVESSKCTSCGSRQFKDHDAKRVCTYCRSEQ